MQGTRRVKGYIVNEPMKLASLENAYLTEVCWKNGNKNEIESAIVMSGKLGKTKKESGEMVEGRFVNQRPSYLVSDLGIEPNPLITISCGKVVNISNQSDKLSNVTVLDTVITGGVLADIDENKVSKLNSKYLLLTEDTESSRLLGIYS